MSDNAERLRRANDELLMAGNDYSDTLLNAAIEIERLRLEVQAGHIYDQQVAEIKRQGLEIDRLRDTIIKLRLRYHAAGSRPEECYEMSVIDIAAG